jgi:hypothetical protein
VDGVGTQLYLSASSEKTMPTVHEEEGCKFKIYTNDHTPAHVHVYVGDGFIRIQLADNFVRSSTNVKESELKKALRLTAKNRGKLYSAWVKIHGEDKGWVE